MTQSRMNRMSLLAVFAHPDDESCGPGGTLARCASEGMQVHLICATRGELGGAPVPHKQRDHLLAELRTAELRAACEALGVKECIVRDYPDGALHNCDQRALQEEVVRAIRRIRPRVIITTDCEEEPDSDHATVARLTTQAWMSASARVAPHLADLLLYCHPGPLRTDHLWRQDFVRVDVTGYRKVKAAALRRHVTQTACTGAALRVIKTAATLYETFAVAYSGLPRDHDLLTKLFQPLEWDKEVRKR